MHYRKILALQKEYGFTDMQNNINNGLVWRMEGSVGREAMRLLESGVCMLPRELTKDAYGNYVTSRDRLPKGSKGTFQNSVKFWTAVLDGKIEID